MRRNKRSREWITFAAGVGLILVLIEAGHLFQGRRAVFPSAGQTLQALTELLGRESTYRQILKTLGHTAQALLISVVLGTGLGLAEGLIPFLHHLLRPLQALLRSMPMILLAMIMLMVTRFSQERMPPATGCLVLIPMISEAACEGCSRIDSELKDVYRLDSRITPGIILRVYLPLTGGYMKQAFVNACGMGLKVTVTAEYLVHTVNSLGQAVYNRLDSLAYEEVFAYALLMVILVMLLTGIPALIFRLYGRQKKEEITSG